MAQEYANGDYIYAAHWLSMKRAIDGNAILSGLEVTENAPPDMDVLVAAGVYYAGGVRRTYGGGTVTIDAADLSDDRWDIISVGNAGLTYTAGVAGAIAATPNLPSADHILVAAILVPTAAASITNTDIYYFRFTNTLLEHGSRHYPDNSDGLAVGVPVDVSTANMEGTANAYARRDHQHGIADDSVATNKMQNLAVTEGKLATAAVTEAKIGAGAVTENKLGALAVTEAKIGAGAVTENKLGALAVTEAKIGTAAVTNTKLGALAVATGNLAAAAVTGAKVASNTLTDSNVAVANKDGLPGTASMRTLGTGAQQACGGNDGRLSDARTPLSHNHTLHTNRTRRWYMNPFAGKPKSGDTTLNATEFTPSAGGTHIGAELPNGTTHYQWFSITPPADLSGTTAYVKLAIMCTGGSSGNVVIDCTTQTPGYTRTTTSQAHAVSGSYVAHTIRTFTIDASYPTLIGIRRNKTGSDTLGGACWIVGMWVEYTADM